MALVVVSALVVEVTGLLGGAAGEWLAWPLLGAVAGPWWRRWLPRPKAVVDAPQLELTWKSIGEAAVACDTAGKLLRMNPAAEALVQRWNVEEVGQPLGQLFELRTPGPDGSRCDAVGAILKGEKSSERAERLVLRRRDGTDRMVSMVATAMWSDAGDLLGAVVVMRDVTAEHQLEEQVRRAQRSDSLAQLAGGVAHDFNNLLQVVRMNSEFLADRSSHDPQACEYVGEINRAASRAAELTHQLMALGRRRPLRKQLLDGRIIVESFMHVIRRLMGPGIEVTFLKPTGPQWISGDTSELENVLLTLCTNAKEAMPLGGSLTIEMKSLELSIEQAERWTWARAGNYIVLSVRDTGLGMDEMTRGRLFEPFFTTKGLGQGAGLGLSIVLGVVQQHQGFINVSSRLGFGSCFDVYLPEQDAPARVAEAAAPAVLNTVAPAELCVLLVEDEPAVRMVATAVLVRHGYRVMEASDGVEACELVRSRGDEIAIVVMDVVMPRMGGIEAARAIIHVRPELPIVLCSGDTAAHARELADGTDRWHLLAKPFGSEELLQAVAGAARGAVHQQ
jgi:two-component system, cell cycle sensor histidine kinase and response regulator CckA